MPPLCSKNFRALLLLGACLGATWPSVPAWAANHPERRWRIHDSEHFRLHFFPEIQGTAERVLSAAEEVYARLRYDFGAPEGARIPIILDPDAFFNGEAEPFKDRITLDPALTSSSIVGTRRFVAHELAHVMTFRSLSTGHVLSKLNGLSTIPTWFLEGVAQYEAEYWYPSLDRMLRLSTLEDKLLTASERQHFRTLGVHSAAAGYTEGYSLCRFIFETYGHRSLSRLMKRLRSGKGNFESAIKATFGKSLQQLEAEWRTGLNRGYQKQVSPKHDQVPGAQTVIASREGEIHIQPKMRADGRQLAFLTSRHQGRFLYLRGQVFGFLSLALANSRGEQVNILPVAQGTISAFAWSPKGDRLAFLQGVRDASNTPIFSLFSYEIASGRLERLSQDENVVALSWRPGSSEIAFVSVNDGNNTLKLVNRYTRKTRTVYQVPDLVQWRDIQFNPDGSSLALVAFKPGENGRLLHFDLSQGLTRVLGEQRQKGSDSHPCWTPDGRNVIYSSEKSGFSQLYSLELSTGKETALTNTFRGAETPSITPDGKFVYYTTYLAQGSRIEKLAIGQASDAEKRHPSVQPENGFSLPHGNAKGGELWDASKPVIPAENVSFFQVGAQSPQLPWRRRAPFERQPPPPWPPIDEAHAKPYQPAMSNDLLIPQMTVDERGQQIGVAGTYSDILQHHELGLDVRWGLWSQRFSYNASYTNKMNTFSWNASLFDVPQLAIAPEVRSESRPLFEHLYLQRRRGLRFDIETPLGAGRHLLTSAQWSTLGTLLAPLSGSNTLQEGSLNTVGAVYREQRVRPDVDQDINPGDGYRLAIAGTVADRRLGSAYDFSQLNVVGERYYPIIRDWRHHLTWRWGLGMQTGDSPVPFLLGGPNASAQLFALRGYAVGSFSGNRLASTGLEYVFPVFKHLDRTLGPLYLDRCYMSTFLDTGGAWQDTLSPRVGSSMGGEIRLRGTVMGRQNLTVRLGFAQALGGDNGSGFYLTF